MKINGHKIVIPKIVMTKSIKTRLEQTVVYVKKRLIDIVDDFPLYDQAIDIVQDQMHKNICKQLKVKNLTEEQEEILLDVLCDHAICFIEKAFRNEFNKKNML